MVNKKDTDHLELQNEMLKKQLSKAEQRIEIIYDILK